MENYSNRLLTLSNLYEWNTKWGWANTHWTLNELNLFKFRTVFVGVDLCFALSALNEWTGLSLNRLISFKGRCVLTRSHLVFHSYQFDCNILVKYLISCMTIFIKFSCYSLSKIKIDREWERREKFILLIVSRT